MKMILTILALALLSACATTGNEEGVTYKRVCTTLEEAGTGTKLGRKVCRRVAVDPATGGEL